MNRLVPLAGAVCIVLVSCWTLSAAPISEEEVARQNEIYNRWWGGDLQWRYDDLPDSGKVDAQRMPWSGYIYPDRAGGCVQVLRKYDWAFNGRRGYASSFEIRDIELHKKTQVRRAGLFGRRTVERRETPSWAGHCNGWAAAAIRHAEPKNNVTRNGVVFRPADIKGLLAELYVYSSIESLGGGDSYSVHPGIFHVVVANWLGLGKHPLAMDNTLGEEVWNYPIYGYATSSAKRGDRLVEVKLNLGYANNINSEYDRAPTAVRYMSFHYQLELDQDGMIVGGAYYRDSSLIDLLWVPLQAAQGGQEGHEDGNPYLDAKEVLALWRDSVPAEARSKWYNINPTPEDAIEGAEEEVTGEVAATD